ncbi:hypothetical protein NHX12_020343 [Muraenolepis orangiensis]|uniref:Glucoside xylosyltransferase 1 n=1 Tax=Muraenolepis orangiensis TaxID=630683 RepID=A0A9Q0ERP2_9TELE|nr:hypothetical protein NHX12_020343 [Muraenolepis orangiensis]
MRRYTRALLWCTVFAVFSGWYIYSQLQVNGDHDDHGGAGGGGGGRHADSAGRRRIHIPFVDKNPHWFHRYIMRGQTVPGGLPGPLEAPSMHLAVVACGDRMEETLTMAKSAVLLSVGHLHLHIFAEEQLHAGFRDTLDSWPGSVRARFNYTVYPISFPSDHAVEWKKLFKPCASQRLFLPLILKDVDSLVYVDSDVVFLQPLDPLWALLWRFNATQLAAVAPEHEEPRLAWYNRFARHPFFGATGLNSGVMVMNLTRIRSAHFKNDMTSVGLRWEELLMPLLQKYKLNITWGDQDLLNIIFHHNPDGVHILHGNRGVFHNLKQPAFQAAYDAIRQYPFGADPNATLLAPLERALLKTTNTYCGKSHALLTKALARSLDNINRRVPPRRSAT